MKIESFMDTLSTEQQQAAFDLLWQRLAADPHTLLPPTWHGEVLAYRSENPSSKPKMSVSEAKVEVTIKTSVLFLLGVLVVAAGCDKPATVATGEPSTVAPAEQGPWITIREDKISASGNLFVKDGLGYRVSNDRFSELLKLIARQNNVNFTVRPASLLDRGAQLEVAGKDLAEVMTNLGTMVRLKIEKTSDTEWVISDASDANGSSGRVTMNDE